MQVSHKRTVVKTLGYRVLSFLTVFIISLLITGGVGTALSISGLTFVAKMFIYYGWERAWTNSDWGTASEHRKF